MPPAQPASHFDNSMNGLTAAVLKHNTPLTLRTLANIRSFTAFRFHTITKPHGLRRRALFQATFPKEISKIYSMQTYRCACIVPRSIQYILKALVEH